MGGRDVGQVPVLFVLILAQSVEQIKHLGQERRDLGSQSGQSQRAQPAQQQGPSSQRSRSRQRRKKAPPGKGGGAVGLKGGAKRGLHLPATATSVGRQATALEIVT